MRDGKPQNHQQTQKSKTMAVCATLILVLVCAVRTLFLIWILTSPPLCAALIQQQQAVGLGETV